MKPRWTSVTSSILETVVYDPAERRLRIRFRTGAIYDDSVPPVVRNELRAAPSKGADFSEYGRPDHLYRRVRGAREAVPAPGR